LSLCRKEKTCPYVILSKKEETRPYVLLSKKEKHVLMSEKVFRKACEGMAVWNFICNFAIRIYLSFHIHQSL